jgi:hypothetical protein
MCPKEEAVVAGFQLPAHNFRTGNMSVSVGSLGMEVRKLDRYLSGGTDKTTKNLRGDSRYPSRDSNRGLSNTYQKVIASFDLLVI